MNRFRILASGLLLLALAPCWALDLAVSKQVNNSRPTDDSQTVEFEVTLTHLSGPPFSGEILVQDPLPAELQLPEFMSPVVSRGQYDPVTGDWIVQDLAEGQRETLIIPAVYKAGEQPPCTVNIARLVFGDDDPANNSSRAVLHAPGVDACVDLWISANAEVDDKDPCDRDMLVTLTFSVTNEGPDDARDVRFSIEETGDKKIPGLRFTSPECIGLSCEIGPLAAGQRTTVSAQSKVFNGESGRTYPLRMNATTSSHDYDPNNNVGEHEFNFGTGRGLCVDVDVGLPGGGGGGSSCFIATAAYGTATDQRIAVLRDFRDNWLLTNSPGRWLTAAYYRHSPPIARYIAENPTRRAIVRTVLSPVLIALTYPWLLIGYLLLAMGVVGRWYISRYGRLVLNNR